MTAVRTRRSPFAAEVRPDGSRRFSHEAVVARRTLLAGLVVAGASGGVLLSRLSTTDRTVAAVDPAVHDPVAAVAAPAPASTSTPSAAPPVVPGPSTTEAGSPWVVVNKQHALDPLEYAPALAVVGGKEVAASIAGDLRALLDAARADGVSLSITSGYRSYARQKSVHDSSVRRNGLETAESLSARPGYSEHQTGLAIDFGGSSAPGCQLENCFGRTRESVWLRANAGRFGFLQRYPEGKTGITGYDPEPWHWRWVGTDLLARMAERRVTTLEEFFGISGGTAYA
ncbi:M15 family metallopeptidase [Kineococcus rhizosphaerae]|uniref:D-alanyl-D-alanine carboxypeptidase n=1 Tax=Kineococcus rhizosphaerae TaxID=559628 RepID=A0A2T0RBU9_9ACTN|nr:M15 family metallopeptidase [Kineococcus rhizosphaerae]PRY18619.1 D-alanyl-D-alanine carboxypeptidase [Kineococcus rhizosphaerae]